MSLFKRDKKRQIIEAQKSFKGRAEKFFKKYQVISRKYGCDFQGYFRKGKKVLPAMISIIDTEELVRKEAEEKKEAENKEK